MTWRTGPVGIEQRAIVADNGIVYAIGESFTSASKIVRALNEQEAGKRAAVQRDAIETLAQRLEAEEEQMRANMAAGTSPWVTREQLSREDVIKELRAVLQGEVPAENRGALVQVRIEPGAASAHYEQPYSFVTRPGAGEINILPAGINGGTVEVTWV